MKRIYVLLVMFVSMNAQPAWDDQLDHEAIEQRLSTEKIVEVMNLRKYLSERGINTRPTHDVRIVKLESGLKGVFKKGAYHHGEVAAYRASKFLGSRLVPPTVYREVNGVQGSLQFFIEAPQVHKVSNMARLVNKVGSKIVSDMNLFYFVFGQWDTHVGNQLVVSYGDKQYLALIDNSVVLHRTYDTYGGATYTSKGRNYDLPSDMGVEFPYNKKQVISGHKSRSLFKHYMGRAECDRLSRENRVTYIIWNHTIWIKLAERGSKRFTKTFYQDTLHAYETLNEEALYYAWEGWAAIDDEHADDLIALTLIKRDEVLEYAQEKGTIYA